jgi:hypothetical protein
VFKIDAFVRRINRDSTIDSICLSCYQTVATAKDEAELTIADEQHVCKSDEAIIIRSDDSLPGAF